MDILSDSGSLGSGGPCPPVDPPRSVFYLSYEVELYPDQEQTVLLDSLSGSQHFPQTAAGVDAFVEGLRWDLLLQLGLT